MNWKALLILIVAVFSGASSQAQVVAPETRNYNGSYCKPYYNDTAGHFRYTVTGIQNHSTTGRYVLCPIKEISSNYMIFVTWTDSGSSQVASCNLYKMRHGTLQRGWSGLNQWQGGSLNVIAIGGHPNLLNGNGNYNPALVCLLPPYATLNNIELSQMAY